jgi:hypothetical protein
MLVQNEFIRRTKHRARMKGKGVKKKVMCVTKELGG